MCMVRAEVVVLLSLIGFILFYRGNGDDSYKIFHHENVALKNFDTRLSDENDSMFSNGVCSIENRSFVETCKSPKNFDDGNCSSNCELHRLKYTQCFCDDSCHMFHDCCIDRVLEDDHFGRKWNCREVTSATGVRYSIYILQTCPESWKDLYTQFLCETEAMDLQNAGMHYSHVQDIPVKSVKTGLFYRNVYCALCNGESSFVKWEYYYFCAGTSGIKHKHDEIDFSQANYRAKTMNFENVKVEGFMTRCRIIVEDFNLTRIVYQHGARLCKPAINTCDTESDKVIRQRCNSYTSFVYEKGLTPVDTRKVYKNFHCALCNKANVKILTCADPLVLREPGKPLKSSSLPFLFDFNFYKEDNNQVGSKIPCKLQDGKIWDPVLKKCEDFTCGILFQRNGSLCVPRVIDKTVSGLNSSCPKKILSKDMFHLIHNESVYINNTGKILSSKEYETFEMNGSAVVSIAVCVDEGSFLLYLSEEQHYLSEVVLSLSIICLILHLFVYCVLKDLRNSPGKVLMALSACLLCGHIFLLVGPLMKNIYWMCYACSVLTHFGYLSSFLWMNVMAYDIYRTFSATQRRISTKKKTFAKYSLYCWITSLVIISTSLLFDNIASEVNQFRPKYGNPICWFNQRKGLLIFFVLPIFILLLENVSFFTIAAFRIRSISQQTKMVNNFSDRVRYFLYLKLSVVFGLTWLLGFLAGLLSVGFLWYPFIILNGLQGVFIFIAFTIKRKIIKMLFVKFRVHSGSYSIGKTSGLKHTLYSSLSNLSNLQTTLTSHLSSSNENPEILKAVRRINPDLMINDKVLQS